MERLRRREVLAGVGGVGSLLAGQYLGSSGLFGQSPSLTTDVHAGTWQEQGRGPRRSGYAPEADPPTEEFSQQWTADVDWANDAFTGSIVVDEDHVYVLETDALVALDRSDGSEQWRFEPPAVAHSIPTDDVDAPGSTWHGFLACRDGQVFVAGRPAKLYVLYAVDAATGAVNWALPGVTGQSVFGAAITTFGGPSSSDSGLYDTESGRSQGELPLTSPGGSGYVAGDPHEFESHRAAGTDDVDWEELRTYALDTFREDVVVNDTGSAVTANGWTVSDGRSADWEGTAVVDVLGGEYTPLETDIPTGATVVTDGDRWYVCTDDAAVAYPVRDPQLDDDSVQAQWRRPLEQPVGRPAVSDGAVYVPTEEGLSVLEKRTGETLQSTGGYAVPEWGWWSPVVAGDTLYCGLGGSDQLYAFT